MKVTLITDATDLSIKEVKHKLMRMIIKLLFILTAVEVHAQHGTGSMYNDSGQLRCDTTLVISPDQMERWLAVEDLLLSHVVRNVRYSDMARDGQVNGQMICSFQVNSSGEVGDIRLISGPGYGMDQLLKRALDSFQLIGSLSGGTAFSDAYFIALDLQLVDARSYVKEHGALPIIGVHSNVIQH